jgi:hypothetical protein
MSRVKCTTIEKYFWIKMAAAWTRLGRTKVLDNSHNVAADIEGDLFLS